MVTFVAQINIVRTNVFELLFLCFIQVRRLNIIERTFGRRRTDNKLFFVLQTRYSSGWNLSFYLLQ